MSSQKNILFYSIFEGDKRSAYLIEKIKANEAIRNQFVLICVNDRNIKLPRIILELKKIPVLIVVGNSQPLVEDETIQWFNEKILGISTDIEFADLNDKSSDYSFINDTMGKGEKEWNIGFDDASTSIRDNFVNIGDENRIETYQESGSKKAASEQINQRMEQMRKIRDEESNSMRRPMGQVQSHGMPFGMMNSI